ncbi:hypothetical protein BT67DRAFT_459144 [Trichocladium antarcticum]|uniref:Uncharacterized protein n=1 Tax=Trichocladium antarcticum TaxID=1450529 RepID=A0AAN6USL5_9PEZI|nr:hypothetical protein BT67DRAFT_459144 [Trichocladium antarcticum]
MIESSDSDGTETGLVDSAMERVVAHPRPAFLEKGDVLRMLELPDDFIIGLDTMAITTDKSFPGFRDIPPGAHFLWVQQPGGVSRCGYWFVATTQGVVRLKQWDRYNEVLGEPASQFEARDEKANIESVYSTLQPYTLGGQRVEPSAVPASSILPDWARSPARVWDTLTTAISTGFLDKITGKRAVREYLIDSMDCARDSRREESRSASKAYVAGVSSELGFLFSQDFRDLQLLDLGPMKTRVADTSARVLELLGDSDTQTTEQDIVAELQFTFLTGTNLSNSACLGQWWNLVLKVVLRAYSLAISRPNLTKDLLQTLYAQLFFTEHYVGSSQQQPEQPPDTSPDGTNDGPSSDRAVFQYKPQNKEKLRLMLAQYKRQLNELLLGLGGQITPEQEAVGRVFEELEVWLWRCNWDLRGEHTLDRNRVDEGDSDEEEDEQPVVVELDGEGREVGLVSFRD